MLIVRLTLDASWYVGSDSMQIHSRVVRFDTAASIEEQIQECHDQRVEILAHPQHPEELVRGALSTAMRKWVTNINQLSPF